VPVVYYPQILGLALGMSSKDLGFKLNRVKASELLRIVEG
jgi:heterodisulfide reductase subunit B